MNFIDKEKLVYWIYGIGIALWVVVIMLIVLQLDEAKKNTAETKRNTEQTQEVVKKQGEVLEAIAKVTTDTKLTAETQTKIIICMLQVPIADRTTDVERQCRATAAASTPTVTTNPLSEAQPSAPQAQPQGNTSKPSSQPQSKPDNSGIVLPLIHVRIPL